MQRFRERLIPGPGTLIAILLLMPAIWVVMLPLSPRVGLIGAIVITIVVEVLMIVAAPVVAVADGVLTAGSARIPVSLTGAMESYRRDDARRSRGTGLDARAFTLFRGWVDPVLRIDLTDPDDPTPYWLVSTRRPDELRAAIAAERGDREG